MYSPTFDILSTTIFYILICLIILLLARNGEKKGNIKLIRWAYVVLGVLTVLRYDVGNDYVGYTEYITAITDRVHLGKSFIQLWVQDDYMHELFFYFISWFFSWMPTPYVWVIGCYAIIAIYLLYKSLNRYKGYHTLGLFIYIVSGMLFNSWDWVRQSVAFMVLLYAIPYIEERKLGRYVIAIFCGILFHKSILLMLPFYFVTYLRVPKLWVVILLPITLFLYFTNFFQNTLGEIMAYADLSEGYKEYATNQQALQQAESLAFKLRTTLYVIAWGYFILIMPENEYVKKNILLIGALFFMIASGSQALMRISFYFIVVSILAAPSAWNNKKLMKIPALKIGFVLLLLVMSGLWVRDIVTNNNRGCTPYDTILLDNYENQKFRPKSY